MCWVVMQGRLGMWSAAMNMVYAVRCRGMMYDVMQGQLCVWPGGMVMMYGV